ncbi:hypothetical protein [Fodinicola acaciae]|uniref:hypothetical protein n=1 Tax=Fodinicola acaciae TaxID=2681555 RepID=UPI0013CFCDC7|nr:hypothetical protein [Fodinicola acaciae]
MRRFYGASGWHLAALLMCFLVAGYAIWLVAADPLAWLMLLWFLGAVVIHDLVLFPVYALVTRSVNYVRVPALASGLLFLLFFPGIVRQGAGSFQDATGLTQQPYLFRWLLFTAAAFALSAIIYVLRGKLGKRTPAKPDRPHRETSRASHRG